MLFWGLLGVNCIYLLAEIVFNVRLIDVASSNATPEQIENIEFFGRALSTIGLSFLFIKLISISGAPKNTKFFMTAIVIVLAHPLFFIGQKEAIDHFANSTNESQKKNYYNTYLLKKAMLGEKSHGQNMNFYDNSGSIYNKVFFSTMGITRHNSEIISLYLEQDSLDEFAAVSEALLMARNIHNQYTESVNNDMLYKKYAQVQGQYMERLNIVEQTAIDQYKRFSSERGRNLLFTRYETIVSNVTDAYNYAIKRMPYDTRSAATEVGRCTTIECMKDRIKNYEKRQKAISKTYLKKQFETLPTFGFYEFCRFSPPSRKNNSFTRITVIEDGKKNQTRRNNHLMYAGASKPDLYCTFNIDRLSDIYGRHFKNMVKNKIDIQNYNIKTVEEFSQSPELRNMLNYVMKQDGIDAKLPKNWHYEDKETFVRIITGNIKESITEQYKKALTEKIGISIPLTLSRVDFMNGPYLQKLINKDLNENYGVVVKEKTANEFFQNNRNKLIKASSESIDNFDFKNNGGDIVKAMIIPPIAMLLSLIFFLLNGLILLRDIMTKMTTNKMSNIITFIGLIIIVFGPAFIPSFDEGHALFMEDLSNNNIFLAYAYDWAISWESILYPLGNGINELIAPQIENQIYSDMFAKISL